MTEKLKICLAQINSTVGDFEGNAKKILREFLKANESGCDLVIFPEMAICGYDAQDLLLKKYFITSAQNKVAEIIDSTKGAKCAILLGSPTLAASRTKKEITHNSAILIEDGQVRKIIHKKSLPNFGVFDESRYFESANFLSCVEFRGFNLAILICEDLWHLKNLYLLQEQSLDAVITINASPYSEQKQSNRAKICKNFASNLGKPLIYVNQVGGQDSLVFDGASFVLNAKGEEAARLACFEEDSQIVEVFKDGLILSEKVSALPETTEKNYAACVLGLKDYVLKNGFKKVIIGMSGGIDSALVATIATDALGAENVKLYALPSRFNSQNSMTDAVNCSQNLGIKLEVISIEEVFKAMLTTLGEISDLAKENLQSRIRGNILMALSNDSGALLISTGNKSELSCGYATLYGDMCGAYNPIKDLYKTQVYELANWRNKEKEIIPQNILTKEPTAELRENQKDSDSLPEYEILDKILYSLIEEEKSVEEIVSQGFEQELVLKISKLLYLSEYKRQQSCLGPKISEMAFDKDRRYQITNKFFK